MKTNQISKKLISDIKKDITLDIPDEHIEAVLTEYVNQQQKEYQIAHKPEHFFERYKHIAYESNEVLVVAALNSNFEITNDEIVYRSLKDRINVDIIDIFKVPMNSHEKHFVMIHNHPSGEQELSAEDISFAQAIRGKAESIGLTFIDSISISRNGFESTREKHARIWEGRRELEY